MIFIELFIRCSKYSFKYTYVKYTFELKLEFNYHFWGVLRDNLCLISSYQRYTSPFDTPHVKIWRNIYNRNDHKLWLCRFVEFLVKT